MLIALRRERATPFYADPRVVGDRAITLTDDPPCAHTDYLDDPEDGAGYARFFPGRQPPGETLTFAGRRGARRVETW